MLLQNLKHIFDETSLIIAFMKGPDHRFEYVNAAHVRLLGMNATGKTVREVQPEAVESGILTQLNHVYNTGESIRFSEEAFPIGEDLRYFDFIYSCSRDRSDKITGVMAMVNDITDRVLARKRVEQSEALLKNTQDQLYLALESAQMGSWSIDLKTNYVTTSPSFAEIFGVSKVEGNIFAEISKYMHPDDVAEVNQVWTEAVAHRKLYNHEYRIVWPSGAVRWVHSRGTVKMSGAGEPLFFSGVLSDVTDRVLTRTLLEKSEARIFQIANAMPQIVWTSPPDGILDYTNDRWTEYSGSAGPETWVDFVHPDDLEATVKAWTHAVKTGERYETEFRLLSKITGTYKWFLVRAQAAFAPDGSIERWIGTCTDIEEQKRALDMRSEFISIASHELKTPLTSLKLQNQMLSRGLEKEPGGSVPKERVQKLIENNEKQVNRLSRLVDDMLDFSKIEAGKLTINRERTDLTILMKEVYERLKPQLERAGCASSLLVPENIFVDVDAFRIEQVIINLLTNAVRYGRQKPVAIALSTFGDSVIISVADQGYGISPDDLQRIFNRFERAVTPSDVSGLGLGLYISRRIIESHQGEIWAESEVGTGSTFYARLPLSESVSAGRTQN